MNPQHRYIVLRRGLPVFTTETCTNLVAYLWGRDIKDRYVVLDYEHPYPVDTPDLLAWIRPLEEAQHRTRLRCMEGERAGPEGGDSPTAHRL
jgi:hypothetical protein